MSELLMKFFDMIGTHPVCFLFLSLSLIFNAICYVVRAVTPIQKPSIMFTIGPVSNKKEK